MRVWACVCVGVFGNKDAVAVDCKLLRRGVVKFAVEDVLRVLCVQAAAAAAAAIAKLNCIFNTAALAKRKKSAQKEHGANNQTQTMTDVTHHISCPFLFSQTRSCCLMRCSCGLLI